jgi:hypothetical protein
MPSSLSVGRAAPGANDFDTPAEVGAFVRQCLRRRASTEKGLSVRDGLVDASPDAVLLQREAMEEALCQRVVGWVLSRPHVNRALKRTGLFASPSVAWRVRAAGRSAPSWWVATTMKARVGYDGAKRKQGSKLDPRQRAVYRTALDVWEMHARRPLIPVSIGTHSITYRFAKPREDALAVPPLPAGDK